MNLFCSKPILSLATPVFIFAACNREQRQKSDSENPVTEIRIEQSVVYQKIPVDTLQSVINWTGFKPGGQHNGSVHLEKGGVLFKDGIPVGGKFSIDMTTIRDEDIKVAPMRKMLESHLMSADFFNVEKYPLATFEITSLTPIDGFYNYTIEGNLTLKDTARLVSFPAKIWQEENIWKAQTDTFSINRTDWGIVYKSKGLMGKLKDEFIHDDMELQIYLQSVK
ncbi:MAG: YceI family protein [Bacteroidales bacterium]|nr:YceI family protein [Bacteroidales bacterium]